jgi:hypothetical protein
MSGRGWTMDMEQERLVSERDRLDNGHGAGAAGQRAGEAGQWTMNMKQEWLDSEWEMDS